MSKYLELSGERIEYVPSHLGGTACVPNGGTVSLTLPDGTRAIYFRAEGGAGYYAVNGTASGTASPGYIPSGGNEMVFCCDNIASVSVNAAASVTIHTQFYSG